MIDIEISEPHSLPIDTIKGIIEKAMPAYTEKYGLTCLWESPTCLAFESAKGVAGKLLLDPAQVTVEATVTGFFVRALTPLIRSGIESEMKALLNPAPK